MMDAYELIYVFRQLSTDKKHIPGPEKKLNLQDQIIL